METTTYAKVYDAGDASQSIDVASQTIPYNLRQVAQCEPLQSPLHKKLCDEPSSEDSTLELIDIEEDDESPCTFPGCYKRSYQCPGQCYFLPDRAFPMPNPGSDGMEGLQALSMSSSGISDPQALPYAAQADSMQPYLSPNQVLFQAATGEMPAYQIRSPSSGMPQGVVVATAPTNLHSPQQMAEEATRKREMRLMKNRESAKACRVRKKEYVRCLEIRVAMLERKNKNLLEMLEAYKDYLPVEYNIIKAAME